MQRVEDALGRVAAALVEFSVKHAAVTLVASLLLSAASLYAAATILTVDTDSDRLLAESVPVGQTNLVIAELFPAFQDNVIVMLEAETAEDAREAALEMRDIIAAMPDRYPEVFLPGYGDYYDDFGIFHLEREELDDLAGQLGQSGELLATLADRAEVPILFGALSHVIASDEGIESIGEEGRAIVEAVAHTVERFNEGERAAIDWDDLLFDDVDEGHTNPQLIFVKPVGDLTQLGPVLTALEHIRSLVPQLEPRPGLRVRVTGDRAAHSEEMSLIIGEVSVAGATSLLLVTAVLLYALRSLRMVVSTVLTLLLGLSWTAGLAAVAVGQLNALTSAFAVVYIGLGVDFGIHFALGYLDRRGDGAGREGALVATGRHVGSSLFLCAITTAIGFYAFIPTDYRAVGEMGIISGTGVFLGLLATLTSFPAMIQLGLDRSKQGAAAQDRLMLSPPTFPLRYPRAVCAVAAVVGVVCTFAAFHVRFEFSTLKVRDPRVESVQAMADLLYSNDISVWTMEIIADDLDDAQRIAARVEELDGIEEVRTAASFVPDDQPERLAIFEQMRTDLTTPAALSAQETGDELDRMQAVEYTIEGYGVALDIDEDLRGGAPEGEPLWDSAQTLREVLDALLRDLRDEKLSPERIDALEEDLFGDLPETIDDVVDMLPTREVTLEDLPADLMTRYIAADGRARVEILSDAYLNDHGELEYFNDTVQAVFPQAGGPVGGTVGLGRAMVSSLRQALLTAVVVIAIGLLLLLRSVKYTAITLAPLAIGSLTTAAVSVVADVPFNFANVIVLPLILGIGVDSGIHLIHRHRQGLGHDPNLLATSTARAVVFSALTTLISFITLAFSNHQGISSLARLLSIGIVFMLAANMIVLPAILAWVDGGAAAGEGEGERA